jgi:hypothetical protein
MQLSLPLGAGKSGEVQDNIQSFSLWPRVVSRRTGRAKEAVSTLPSLANLAKLGHFSPSSTVTSKVPLVTYYRCGNSGIFWRGLIHSTPLTKIADITVPTRTARTNTNPISAV